MTKTNLPLFGLSFLSVTLTSNAKEIKKPNFIIIMADDMGYGDIGCFGNKQILTPYLDRMAKNGVKFLDFHSNGAVSSPTRAALLTGNYQQRSGITGVLLAKSDRDKGLPLSEVTFAEALKKEGYVTGMFGKWHLGYLQEFNPVNQGFDEYIGYVSGNIDYQSHIDQEGNADWWTAEKLENQLGYSTDLISNNANDFIIKHKDESFLLYIAHEAPHSPYQSRDSKADRFPGAKIGKGFPPNGSEMDIKSVYKKMVEILDENVGKTLKTLKDLKLDKNTIVIFCSDNGATNKGSNGVLKGYKGSVSEGGHRVPAIIQWPSHIKSGGVCNEPVLTMDFFPTMLELAGSKQDFILDGISIAKYLIESKPLSPRLLFWQHANSYAVRKGNWKMVLSNINAKPEFFDLNLDIQEANNIADKNPTLVNELMTELQKWKIEVNNED